MLTFQFVPYSEIQALSSEYRIKKLLKLVKAHNIVLLGGKLKAQEEAELIRRTMESIDKDFKGIELATIQPKKVNKLKQNIMKYIFKEEQGFTIIGPATIIKEIKQNPGKIQLFTKNEIKKRTVKRKK